MHNTNKTLQENQLNELISKDHKVKGTNKIERCFLIAVLRVCDQVRLFLSLN